jgi:hypothetical protein
MHDGLEDRLLRDWQGCGPGSETALVIQVPVGFAGLGFEYSSRLLPA